jgi:hypothetical protein
LNTQKKLLGCMMATAMILSGSFVLTAPASSQVPVRCSTEDMAYARGYANGSCIADGYSGGHVTSCSGGEFTYNCYTVVG